MPPHACRAVWCETEPSTAIAARTPRPSIQGMLSGIPFVTFVVQRGESLLKPAAVRSLRVPPLPVCEVGAFPIVTELPAVPFVAPSMNSTRATPFPCNPVGPRAGVYGLPLVFPVPASTRGTFEPPAAGIHLRNRCLRRGRRRRQFRRRSRLRAYVVSRATFVSPAVPAAVAAFVPVVTTAMPVFAATFAVVRMLPLSEMPVSLPTQAPS